MTDLPVELRIGDRERRAVDGQLQAAVGDGVLTLAEYDERAARLWEARTVADLAALVSDLPSSRPVGTAVLPSAPATTLPPRRSLAVMSGDELSGPFPAGQAVETYAVMGGAVIDLRREDLPAEVRVKAVAVMGGVEVLVPRGATVHLTGMAVMGGRESKVDAPVPGGPVVHLDAWALMGGVVVGHGKGESAQVVARPGHQVAHPGLIPHVPAQHGWSSPPAVPPRTPARRAGRVRRSLSKAVVLAALLAGAGGVVAAGDDGSAVFGSRTIQLSDGERDVSVLFGSVTVVVPDGTQVVTAGGTVVFGSVECTQACDPGQGSGVVRLRSWGAFGSVEVVPRSEAPDRDDD